MSKIAHQASSCRGHHIGHLYGSPTIVDGAVRTRPEVGVRWLLLSLVFVSLVVERLLALIRWLV